MHTIFKIFVRFPISPLYKNSRFISFQNFWRNIVDGFSETVIIKDTKTDTFVFIVTTL